MAIGNETDARAAIMGQLPMIGEGWYREAYLKDGIVYKVNIPERFAEEGDQNLVEYTNIQLINRDSLPDWLVIPEVSLYEIADDSVIAMPFFTGDPVGECYCADNEPCGDSCLSIGIVKQIISYTGLIDLGYENVIRQNNGTYVVIDCNL